MDEEKRFYSSDTNSRMLKKQVSSYSSLKTAESQVLDYRNQLNHILTKNTALSAKINELENEMVAFEAEEAKIMKESHSVDEEIRDMTAKCSMAYSELDCEEIALVKLKVKSAHERSEFENKMRSKNGQSNEIGDYVIESSRGLNVSGLERETVDFCESELQKSADRVILAASEVATEDYKKKDESLSSKCEFLFNLESLMKCLAKAEGDNYKLHQLATRLESEVASLKCQLEKNNDDETGETDRKSTTHAQTCCVLMMTEMSKLLNEYMGDLDSMKARHDIVRDLLRILKRYLQFAPGCDEHAMSGASSTTLEFMNSELFQTQERVERIFEMFAISEYATAQHLMRNV